MTGGQAVAGSNPVVPTSFDAGRKPFSRVPFGFLLDLSGAGVSHQSKGDPGALVEDVEAHEQTVANLQFGQRLSACVLLLLRLGGEARVISPPDLRDAVRELAERTLRPYRRSPAGEG